MAVFWIITPTISREGRQIAFGFEVSRCETIDDLKACLVKDGMICGLRLDLRSEGDRCRRIVGRRPTMLTATGINQAAPMDWTLIEGEKV